MHKVNLQLFPYCRQGSVCSVKKRFSIDIILRSEPFPFHYTPKSLSNIQMRRIWGKVEKKESPFSPDGTHLLDFCITVNTGIIQHDKCLFADFEREAFEKGYDFLGIDRLGCIKSFKMIVSVNHSKDIKPLGFYILSRELPAVRAN